MPRFFRWPEWPTCSCSPSRLVDRWEELRAAGLDLSTEDKAALMKRKLALRILVSATAGGVHDFETFKGTGAAKPRWQLAR